MKYLIIQSLHAVMYMYVPWKIYKGNYGTIQKWCSAL